MRYTKKVNVKNQITDASLVILGTTRRATRSCCSFAMTKRQYLNISFAVVVAIAV